MKKNINKEVTVCDKCGKENYVEACLNCAVEMCYECRIKHGVSYSYGVFFQGSGDGFYCNACDDKLNKSKSDKRHNAYTSIRNLRVEHESWSEDFRQRSSDAEKRLEKLRR